MWRLSSWALVLEVCYLNPMFPGFWVSHHGSCWCALNEENRRDIYCTDYTRWGLIFRDTRHHLRKSKFMELMQAQRSKSTQFVERWSKAEFMNQRLLFICFGLSLACVVLACSLVYLAVKPKPIYYLPSSWQAGIALPASSSLGIASAFVASWLLDWSNFNPATATDVYTRAQRIMSPYLLSRTRSRLSKDLEEIKRNDISSLFTIARDPDIVKVGKGFKVMVKGKKVLFMGKEMVKEQDLTFNVEVIAVGPTEINPFGLLIASIEQEQNQ